MINKSKSYKVEERDSVNILGFEKEPLQTVYVDEFELLTRKCC